MAARAERVAIVERFRRLQAELDRDQRTMVARFGSATPSVRAQASIDWETRNRPRIEAIQTLAAQLTALCPEPALPFIRRLEIPPSASPALEELLVARAEVHNEDALLQRQLRGVSTEQASQLRTEAAARPSSARNRLEAYAREVAAESVTPRPKLPAAPTIPSNASPALREFLRARHALLRQEAALDLQNRALPPAAQEQARQVWRESNRLKLEALQRQAEQLSAEN